MPLHLAPLSRRRFLKKSAVVAGALGLAPHLLAAGKKVAEDSWFLLSDPHLAADHAQLGRGINMVDHFNTVARELTSLPHLPAGVFINGDCAFNSGEAGDYATVAELLEPLRKEGMPIHMVLGNHDQREHFWQAFQAEHNAPRPVADRQASLLKTSRANWFILDSLEKTLSTPGLLGPEQLDWLAKALDENPKKPAIVLVHHNPGLSGNMGLKDTQSFFEIIRPRKQVKAYIYGHTHTWRIEEDVSGIHFINLPPTSYLFKEGNPSGWVQATIANDGMKLELRCLDTTHKQHGEVNDLKWRV
jgi:3',5'-cyclic AMP phosphodiesterase CpdA